MSKQPVPEAGVLLTQVQRRDGCNIADPVPRGAPEGIVRVIAQAIGWQHTRAGRSSHKRGYGCCVSRIEFAAASQRLNYRRPRHCKARCLTVNALRAGCRKHAGATKTMPPYQRE